MTDIERSSPEIDDPLEKRLVASWRTDGPSAASKAATLALFAGGATAATALATSKSAAASTLASGAKGGVATKAAAAGLPLAVKLSGLVLLGAAGLGGAAYVAGRQPRAVATSAPAQASRAAPTATPTATSTATATPTATATADGLAAPTIAPVDVASLKSVPSSAHRENRPAPATTSTAGAGEPAGGVSAVAPARPAVALDDQVAAIDRARLALERGDSAECLAALARYDRAYPDGMLSQEATLLRIQALVGRGDRAEARSVADRFLATHPASPHEQRIRRMLGTNP